MARLLRKGLNVAILTGGGDVPLNPCIRSLALQIVAAGLGLGLELIGIRRGWKGLIGSIDANCVSKLTPDNTRTIERTGGTILHSSRTNPARVPIAEVAEHHRHRLPELLEVEPGVFDMTPIVLETVERLRLDWLIVIGGDDTLSYAWKLSQMGVPIVAIPKTMDCDVPETEYCLGASTAISRIIEIVNRLRSTLGSHERVGFLRVFGRDAGFTAFLPAYLMHTRCCIPEHVFEKHRLFELLLRDRANNPSRYTFVLMSEGATWAGRSVESFGPADAFGHKRKTNVAELLAGEFQNEIGVDAISVDLTYELRSGEADLHDRLVSVAFASLTAQLIGDGARGRMTAMKNGAYTDVSIPDTSLGPKRLNLVHDYDVSELRPAYRSPIGRSLFAVG